MGSKVPGRTELTGLILLAILVVAITACGLLMKQCRQAPAEPEVKIEVIEETANAPDEAYKEKKRKEAKERGEKKDRKKTKSKRTEKKVPVERKDPFGDTIPVY